MPSLIFLTSLNNLSVRAYTGFIPVKINGLCKSIVSEHRNTQLLFRLLRKFFAPYEFLSGFLKFILHIRRRKLLVGRVAFFSLSLRMTIPDR